MSLFLFLGLPLFSFTLVLKISNQVSPLLDFSSLPLVPPQTVFSCFVVMSLSRKTVDRKNKTKEKRLYIYPLLQPSSKLWVWDYVPGEVKSGNSDGEIEKVLRTLQRQPS